MNKWLERALISAGAAVVSTTAIVTTAERPGKRKKRKKKGSKDSRGKDGALVDEEVPRSIGAQAAHDYRSGIEGGITPREMLENMKEASQKAARNISRVGGYLLGRQKPPPAAEGEGEGEEPYDEDAAAPRPAKKGRKKVRRRVRRKVGEAPPEGARRTGAKKKRRARREDRESDFDELRDEAVKRAASAAAKHAADKSGLKDAARTIKESGEELWKKTEQLGRSVKDRVPEDLGEKVGDRIGEAGKGIAKGARALSERLRAALSEEEAERERRDRADEVISTVDVPSAAPEDDGPPAADEAGEDVSERVGRGLKGFARWVEGPGAPRDDRPAGRPSRVRPAHGDEDVVEAKEAEGPDLTRARDADVVTPREPPDLSREEREAGPSDDEQNQ